MLRSLATISTFVAACRHARTSATAPAHLVLLDPGNTSHRRIQSVFDLMAGVGLLSLLIVMMIFRGGAARKKWPSRQSTPKQRYFAFHTGVFVTVTALCAAVLIPDRDGEPFFGGIAPSKAAVTTEHLRSGIPDAADQASPRPAIALPFASQDEMPWVAVKKPMPMFSLEGPEVEGSELEYRVFTRGPAARQDTMTFMPKPSQAATRPQVYIVIERFEASRPTQKPLFADLAARAAERHASLERMSPPADLPSKFGPIQIAEAVIGHDGAPLGCLAFRRIDMAGITLAGWYCAPAKRPVNRVELTCFLNRLDLIGAGNDTRLKQIFAEAERQRGACSSSRQAGRKITWLDHEAPVPSLKLNSKPR